MHYILAVNLWIRTRAGHHIHVAALFAILKWLVCWHSPIKAFHSPYYLERTQRSSHRELFFLKIETDDHNSKSTHTIVYPIIPLALRPVEHDDFLPNPKTPEHWTLHEKQPASL